LRDSAKSNSSEAHHVADQPWTSSVLLDASGVDFETNRSRCLASDDTQLILARKMLALVGRRAAAQGCAHSGPSPRRNETPGRTMADAVNDREALYRE